MHLLSIYSLFIFKKVRPIYPIYVILWLLKLNKYSLIHPNIEKFYIFFIRK